MFSCLDLDKDNFRGEGSSSNAHVHVEPIQKDLCINSHNNPVSLFVNVVTAAVPFPRTMWIEFCLRSHSLSFHLNTPIKT